MQEWRFRRRRRQRRLEEAEVAGAARVAELRAELLLLHREPPQVRVLQQERVQPEARDVEVVEPPVAVAAAVAEVVVQQYPQCRPPPVQLVDLRPAGGMNLMPWRGMKIEVEGTLGAKPASGPQEITLTSARSVQGVCTPK